ncbi:MAG: hypothetical protein JST39_13020 [Bacteroidetes bacterium]|nr:hypothetical protein [Bacteroidota bacterium]
MQLSNGPLFLSMFLIVLFLAAGGLFLFFFISALFKKGMGRMSLFTGVVTGVSAMLFLLDRIGAGITWLLPVRMVLHPVNPIWQMILSLGITALLVYVFLTALRARDIRVIIIAWLFFLVFNAGDMIYCFWQYISWDMPRTRTGHKVFSIARLYNPRAEYLRKMIVPSFWTLVSFFSLAKSIKEKIHIHLEAQQGRPPQAPFS